MYNYKLFCLQKKTLSLEMILRLYLALLLLYLHLTFLSNFLFFNLS